MLPVNLYCLLVYSLNPPDFENDRYNIIRIEMIETILSEMNEEMIFVPTFQENNNLRRIYVRERECEGREIEREKEKKNRRDRKKERDEEEGERVKEKKREERIRESDRESFVKN